MHDLVEGAVGRDPAVLDQQGPVADLLEQRMVVPGRDDDPAPPEQLQRALLHALAKLVVERLVHLVEEQDVGPRLVDDREAEAREHALRIARDRPVERVVESASLADRVDVPAGLRARETGEHAEQERILASGQPR